MSWHDLASIHPSWNLDRLRQQLVEHWYVCFALIKFSLTGGCVRQVPAGVDALTTPVRPWRHAVITSPATSERSDAAVTTSDSLDDAPYEFEEEADEDKGDEALIRDFD